MFHYEVKPAQQATVEIIERPSMNKTFEVSYVPKGYTCKSSDIFQDPIRFSE